MGFPSKADIEGMARPSLRVNVGKQSRVQPLEADFTANKFEELVDGESSLATWHLPPPSVGTVRCDYILVPTNIKVMPRSCRTLPHFLTEGMVKITSRWLYNA